MALKILKRIEQQDAYANLALDAALRRWPASRQERGFCTDLVYGTIRWRQNLDWMLQFYLSRPLEQLAPDARHILRMAFYQLAVMNHKPEAAIVDEAVSLARRYTHQGVAGLVNAVLRSYLRNPEKISYPPWDGQPADYLALRLSHPRWLVERWLSVYGSENAKRLCEFNNQPAPVWVRTNTLRCTRAELMARLTGEKVTATASAWVPEGVMLSGFDRVDMSPAYRDGWFTVQDESSMLVTHVVAPIPGETVIDLCAAPGGKSTHLAQRMENRGQVIGVDLHDQRVKLIQETARRLGTDIVATVEGDALDFAMPGGQQADAVLLDAPCTGTGVLRRRADARWRKTIQELEELAGLQSRLLARAASLVRPGGRLVYSTCSLEPEENIMNVIGFLQEHPDFQAASIDSWLPGPVREARHNVTLDWVSAGNAGGNDHYFTDLAIAGLDGACIEVVPWIFGTDGFFIARLERKGGL